MKPGPGNTDARTTIVDVATAAGVAVGTASNALNGRGRMSDATRTRVAQVADMMGYRPRASARALRKGTTMALGLRFGAGVVPRAEFIIDLLNGAVTAAHMRGYGLLISAPSLNEAEIVDGLIVVDPIDPKDVEVEGVPVITVGRAPSQRHIPYIDVDFDALTSLLMECVEPFAPEGPVWLLNERSAASFATDTPAAVRRWCERHGRAITVIGCSERADSAVPTLEHELARSGLPAVLIAPTVGHAAMIQRYLQARSVRIPEQVALVCQCADGARMELDPPIPSCDTACWEQGRQAVDALLDWLDTDVPPGDILVAPRLLWPSQEESGIAGST